MEYMNISYIYQCKEWFNYIMRVKRYTPPGTSIRNRIILITIFIIAIILIRFLYIYEEGKALSTIPKSGNMRFTVQFCSAELVKNNSVGNNWSFKAKINGINVKEGKKIKIRAKNDDKISFSASAKERDFHPDIGNGGISVNIKELKLTERNSFAIEVTVAENRGKYLGNTAIWKFNFSITRKVNFFDIVNNMF